MSAQDPQDLTPAARSTALLVSRLMFYNSLLMGLAFAVTGVAVLMSSLGSLPEPMERFLVAAVLFGLSVMAFGFTAISRRRIAKLKNPGSQVSPSP